MENLQQRNANLEKEVTAYKNRRKIEREIELLEVILPCKEYLDARNEYDVLKTRRQEVHAKAQALKDRSKPVMDFKEFGFCLLSFLLLIRGCSGHFHGVLPLQTPKRRSIGGPLRENSIP